MSMAGQRANMRETQRPIKPVPDIMTNGRTKRPFIKFLSCSTFRTKFNLAQFGAPWGKLLPWLVSAVRRLLMAVRSFAPLRRIIGREVVEYRPDARNQKYTIYAIADTLECGHVTENYLYGGLNDLLYAYTDNPVVRARRHRCQPCLRLLAEKKPVRSVDLAAAVRAG